MASISSLDLLPEPDLHPIYPTAAHISILLSSHSGLNPAQKTELVHHCTIRACVFGDLGLLQYLVLDPQAQTYVDLALRDEDGLGLISLTIHGFGSESDKDVEREECVRFLIAQGAGLTPDKAGWTPLHHAALLSPPTLVSHLMTHGCSPFAPTRRNLTPLDIVTAHSVLPGREDVALLLEESMRGEGWVGGRMEQSRRQTEKRHRTSEQRLELHAGIGRVLGVGSQWWKSNHSSDDEDEGDDSEQQGTESHPEVYTPHPDYTSMLVFSPPDLPHIFESLITNFRPALGDATPANTLYMLARFACLTCDHTWLEDLIIGATDVIEETFFNHADDVTCLVFWLYNTTIWLHLLQCDQAIREACEMLGSFDLIEEVINSVFVFIIRFAERKIDQILNAALLDHSSALDLDSVQFESDWSFLRPFSGKRKATPFRASTPSSPPSPNRPLSPSMSQATVSSSASRNFASLRQTLGRSTPNTLRTPLTLLFSDNPTQPSPVDFSSFLTALHALLVLSNINPVLITQMWSQVMYWTSCEIFNRIITRKKYLCRSRAAQISQNLTVLDTWVHDMKLPRGIQLHLLPVKDLLNWLQCLSAITEFSDLVATIQGMKSINPLQMRRAVRDYKYEVNEGKMTDECVQYLTQLQRDWERHRVKVGVEALRKEIVERDRDGSEFSFADESSVSESLPEVPTIPTREQNQRHSIDILFKAEALTHWEPLKPPQALGELLDSRHMLPLLFPSDPHMLAAFPAKDALPPSLLGDDPRDDHFSGTSNESLHRNQIQQMRWRVRNEKVREVGAEILQWVDGVRPVSRWRTAFDLEDTEDVETRAPEVIMDGVTDLGAQELRITPLTRQPSGRKGRASHGGDVTPVE